MMDASVFTLNANKRQINTKIEVKERLRSKGSLKAYITQGQSHHPITLVNELTFTHIMPLGPLAYFLGSVSLTTPGQQLHSIVMSTEYLLSNFPMATEDKSVPFSDLYAKKLSELHIGLLSTRSI